MESVPDDDGEICESEQFKNVKLVWRRIAQSPRCEDIGWNFIKVTGTNIATIADSGLRTWINIGRKYTGIEKDWMQKIYEEIQVGMWTRYVRE